MILERVFLALQLAHLPLELANLDRRQRKIVFELVLDLLNLLVNAHDFCLLLLGKFDSLRCVRWAEAELTVVGMRVLCRLGNFLQRHLDWLVLLRWLLLGLGRPLVELWRLHRLLLDWLIVVFALLHHFFVYDRLLDGLGSLVFSLGLLGGDVIQVLLLLGERPVFDLAVGVWVELVGQVLQESRAAAVNDRAPDGPERVAVDVQNLNRWVCANVVRQPV